MPAGPCSVQNCYESAGQSKHCFPDPVKDRELFDKWVVLCGNRRLVSEMTPQKVHSSYRVCSLHFVPEDFGPNHRLKKGVFPSLKLPEPLKLHSRFSDPVPAQKVEVVKDDAVPSTSRGQEAVFNEDHDILQSSSENVPLPRTPKKRSLLLSEINVSRLKSLSPKAMHLYKRARQFKKKALYLRKRKLSFQRRLKRSEKMSKVEMFDKVVSSMDRIRSRFFKSQIENVDRKPKGRRYTLEDKVLALALHKQSGTGYRYLSKLFALPSRKTITRLLNRIPIKPGLHNEVFTVLKAECRNFKNPLDKHCLIMFDEMSIQPNLLPNVNKGKVDGFEDLGFRQTENIANHAQVFMLRGIRRKWKQPVYYNFVNGGTKKHDLCNIIKQIVRKCHSIGLNVVATVCDQGANNQAAINLLVKQTWECYRRKGIENQDYLFEIDGRKIVPLFDTPHLMKGLRNNLLKYDLTFVDDGRTRTGKWSDIYTAYKMDPYLGSLRLMPKITDAHVNPEKVMKMKVSKCTQVFSHTVATALNVFAFSGTTVNTGAEILRLDQNAADTAILLEFLDQLFDSLNGSSFQPPPGKFLRTAVKNGSPHRVFWSSALEKLGTFRFMKDGKKFIPPSVSNLIRTIKNFMELWTILSHLGFSYMMPRTFNQDPLENFFGRIRQRGQRNINPTPYDFTNYYKSLLVNNLTSNHSVGGNCEDDKSEMFLTLQRLVSQGLPEEYETEEQEDYFVPENVPISLKPLESKVLHYVAGYITKKIGKLPCSCKESFLKDDRDLEDEGFSRLKEYRSNFRSLRYVNDAFLDKMKKCLVFIRYIFNRHLHTPNLIPRTLSTLNKKISFTDCFHENKIKNDILRYFIKVNIFNYCKQVNQVIKGLDMRPIPKNAPKIFLYAKKIQLNNIKRRKAQNKNILSLSTLEYLLDDPTIHLQLFSFRVP